MQTKTCSTCGEEKPLTEFYKMKRGKYGVQSKCKQCVKEYRHEYGRRPEVRERHREYMRKYLQKPGMRERHRELTRELMKDPVRIEQKRKRNNEDYRLRKELGLVSNKHFEVTKKYATRKGSWSDAEVQFLMTSGLPLVDIALELGRTYGSVQTKRCEMRKLQDSQ